MQFALTECHAVRDDVFLGSCSFTVMGAFLVLEKFLWPKRKAIVFLTTSLK